ncbi:protein phosphatase 2C domain-containing protein [Streptomyces sp. NPDC059787]|uniref:protein phosphatase 2C domain-containing protein n=1 Tax=Streptomyces sp. NPDC059787 TaxID=3346947 RepID=UPI003664A221
MLKLANLMAVVAAVVVTVSLLTVVILMVRELRLPLVHRPRPRNDAPAGPGEPSAPPHGRPPADRGAPKKGVRAATPAKRHTPGTPGHGAPPRLREPSRTLPALSPPAASAGRPPAQDETSAEEQHPAEPILTPRRSLPALPPEKRPEAPDAGAPRESVQLPETVPQRQCEDGAEVWLHAGAATTAGRHRRRNEDSHFADTDLLVVADGVGGAPAGEVASKLAVEAVVQAWRRGAQHTHHHLQGGFRDANAAVLQHVKGNPRLRGMATTLDACAVIGDRIMGAHVGDGYVWAVPPERTAVRQITMPHSAPQGPLLRMIGSSVPVRPDLWAIDACPDTRLVLSSDGLPADLDERELHRLILATADMAPAEAASILMKSALKAGGTDNITVIVADVVLSGSIEQPLLFSE